MWTAEEYLAHSAKGTSWSKKDHKYVRKENGKYYYEDSALNTAREKAEEAFNKVKDMREFEWKGLLDALGHYIKDVINGGFSEAGEKISKRWENRNVEDLTAPDGQRGTQGDDMAVGYTIDGNGNYSEHVVPSVAGYYSHNSHGGNPGHNPYAQMNAHAQQYYSEHSNPLESSHWTANSHGTHVITKKKKR